jgi:hypothetical protein
MFVSRGNFNAPLAILFFSGALILFVQALSVDTRGEIDRSDPWDPNRKFCGRLTIHLNGAGEMRPILKDGVEGERNILGEYAEANFRDLYGGDQTSMPSISLLMSSDLNVQRTINKFAAKERKIFGGAIFSSSEDAFQEFLSNDIKISLLEKAIDYFAKTDGCKRLMGQEKSVLPYLKTEIVIETDHAPTGIPIWSEKNETGSLDSYYQQDHPKVIDSQLLTKLRDRLGRSVVQTFVDACEAVEIAQAIQNSSECSCYISTTDENTYITPNADSTSKFSPGLTEIKGVNDPNPLLESRNAIRMIPKMMGSFQTYTYSPKDGSGRASIFRPCDRINPLLCFVYNSADARADGVLRTLAKEEVEGSLPRQLADANFISDIQSALEIRQKEPLANKQTDERNSNHIQLNRVLALSGLIRKQWSSITNDAREDANDYSYLEFMTRFRKCADRQNPPEVCGAFSKVFQTAVHGTGASGVQISEDRDLIDGRDELLAAFDRIDVPNLLGRYKTREITLTDLLRQLKQLSDTFELYREKLTKYAKENNGGDLPKELAPAFREMNGSFRSGMYAIQRKFFPILRKEALEVRLSKIEETAKLLDRHRNEMVGTMDLNRELQGLGNDLACLFYYPVGPAFDRTNGSLPNADLLTRLNKGVVVPAKQLDGRTSGR